MTGSLQEKNGRYQMVINTKDANGKRKVKWISTGLPIKGNKRKAEQMLNALLVEYTDMGYVEPLKVRFGDFVLDWVEMNCSKLEATTYMNYIHLLKKHVCPYFQATGLQLQDITPDIIQRYYNAKANEGLSPNTIIKHHAVIRSALQYAVRTKLLKENPCDFVDKPKRRKYVGEFYNAAEIKKLFEAAKGSPIEMPIFLASYFGLSRSECLGLRWDAIDFFRGMLTVRRKVVRAVVDGKLVNIDSGKLKTEARYRVLPLDDQLMEFLREARNRQEWHRQICGDSYGKDYLDHVCVNGMGELLNPDYVTDAFSKLLKSNGLKQIRFHDLRHSCASLLLALGYSMKDIQEWLGHSNFQTTANIYSHVDPRNKKEMIRGLSSALGNLNEPN